MAYKIQTSEIIKAKTKQKQFNTGECQCQQEKGSEAAAHLGDFSVTELHTHNEFKMREESECEQN